MYSLASPCWLQHKHQKAIATSFLIPCSLYLDLKSTFSSLYWELYMYFLTCNPTQSLQISYEIFLLLSCFYSVKVCSVLMLSAYSVVYCSNSFCMYPHWLCVTTRRQNSFHHGLYICYFSLLSIHTSLFPEESPLLCVAVNQGGFLCWEQSEHFPLEVPWGSNSYQEHRNCPGSSHSLHLIIRLLGIIQPSPTMSL